MYIIIPRPISLFAMDYIGYNCLTSSRVTLNIKDDSSLILKIMKTGHTGNLGSVTCVNNSKNGLVLGQKYTVSHEEVISAPRFGGTYITIGDENFKKEDFIEDRYCTPKLQGILQVCASKGYVIEKLGNVDTGFFAPKQLKLILAQRSEVVLTKEQLNTLQDGEILTIGREKSPFCNVAPQNIDLHVSSIHCFLQKTAEGIQVYDCSANGTTASQSFDNRVFKKI